MGPGGRAAGQPAQWHRRAGVHRGLREAGTLYWVTQYQDFATLLQVMERMPQDQPLQDAVARGSELIVGGTLRDRVLRSL